MDSGQYEGLNILSDHLNEEKGSRLLYFSVSYWLSSMSLIMDIWEVIDMTPMR